MKNPKKVAAGKKRAKQALRIGGRFTSNAFRKRIEQIKESQGVDISTEKFFLENEIEFETLFRTGTIADPVRKSLTRVYEESKNINGRILLNGKKVTPDELFFQMNIFEQKLMNETNTSGIEYKTFTNFSGDLIINLPFMETDENEEIDLSEIEDEDLVVEAEQNGVIVYTSPKKDAKQMNDEEKEKYEKKIKARQAKKKRVDERVKIVSKLKEENRQHRTIKKEIDKTVKNANKTEGGTKKGRT